ncbi:MAG: diguanylate cyclase, partial [Aquificaceae bacterium]|nr:diguanylate cyclase [Aquificaceae bacterium]
TGLEEARFVAERIRLEAERLKVGEVPKITLSSGVAYYRRGESIESLINRADKALYMAKKLGKNRVVSEDMLEGEEDKAERPL